MLSLRNPDMPIRILLDVGQDAGMSDVLNALNPRLAETIIDARRTGPELVLEMQKALEKNAVVSTLADRLRPGNPAIVANFLGRTRAVPGLALAVRHRAACAGGAGLRAVSRRQRYELHFESFDFELPRDRRAA